MSLGTLAAGAAVAVEVTPIDRVGNAGPATTATLTTTDAPDDEVDFELGDDITGLAAPNAQAEPLPKSVKCRGQIEDAGPLIGNLAGEPKIRAYFTMRAWCFPVDPANPRHTALFASSSLNVHACLQVLLPSGLWDDIKCDQASGDAVSVAKPLRLSAEQLCRPGSPPYRVNVRATVRGGRFVPRSTLQHGRTNNLDCNEAGAWRRLASYGPSAGTVLGNALDAAGSTEDPRPAGDPSLTGQQGWEAHHIVPAGEGAGTEGIETVASERAQRFAYDCGILPNEAVNGVWLRGPKLADGTTGFGTLSTAAQMRAEHRSVAGVHGSNRRDGYYRYVGNKLSAFVEQSTERCTSFVGAEGALCSVRGSLKSGTIPVA